MEAATSTLFTSWGIDEGRELVYVEADGVAREFEILSDDDLQIDLYRAGVSKESIRLILRNVRYSRSEGSCCTIYDHSPPCSRRAPATLERPAGGTDERRTEPAGFTCHGRALLRTVSLLKLALAVSFAVIAALVWRVRL